MDGQVSGLGDQDRNMSHGNNSLKASYWLQNYGDKCVKIQHSNSCLQDYGRDVFFCSPPSAVHLRSRSL